MKRLLFLGLGSALMFTMGGVGPAQADNGPHISSAPTTAGTFVVDANLGAGACASCHRAHTAQASFLLKDAQPGLCYTCHAAGTGSKLDVKNGRNTVSTGALRGGGFAFAKMNAAAPIKVMTFTNGVDALGGLTTASKSIGVLAAGLPTTSQHNVGTVAGDNASGTMWGNGAISPTVNTGQAGITLECGSCHDPHGNGNYRILKPVPNDSAMPKLADPITGLLTVTNPGVKIPDAAGDPRGAGAANRYYDTADYWNVTDPNVPAQAVAGGGTVLTDGYIANVAQWCSTCHTRYLAGSGSYKTPNADATGAIDAVFTYRHRSDSTTKGGVSRPNCIQCHVSHGTNASMADSAPVAMPGAATGSDDSRLLRVNNRATCLMCHSK